MNVEAVEEEVTMAVRDQSQKVGFAYTNIYEIYKKAKHAEVAVSSGKILKKEDLGEVKIAKFEPRRLNQNPLNQPNPVSDLKNGTPNSFDDLKNNLNRLQDMHSKLRFMLKELEDLVAKKK